MIARHEQLATAPAGRILGIDPGATTGWVVYDTEKRRVLARGTFENDDLIREDVQRHSPDVVVIERPRGYGPSYPQVVECGIVFGRLAERCDGWGFEVDEMLRLDVCRTLTDAVHGVLRVKNDTTAWAALKLLHGEGCDKKGGALHGVKAHERAALAVAVAWVLRSAVTAGVRT